MKIKTKLTYGIGILFAMIVLLGALSLGYINKLNNETQKIYTNNNYSLNYCRNMLIVLDNVHTSKSALQVFMSNLQKQQKNLTEVNEKETTDKLSFHFEELRNKINEQNLQKVRSDIYDIMNLNMASIYHKSELAKKTASNALLWIYMTFATCVFFALAILFRFPHSIIKPIKELTGGIMEIANHNYDKRLNFEPTSEFGEVSTSFNKMAERLNEYRASTLADLIANKKYIEAIVNSITEPIIGLNNEKEILFINDEALNILNLKRENVIKKSASELSLKNDLLRRLIRELVNPGEKKEPLKIYADNKESYFQANYIPIRAVETGETEPHSIGDVILLKNITEFKELDTAKTTFLSTISHELKTPISAIMMSLQLLEDKRIGELNEEQEFLSQGIKDNSERLLNITGELLKITQVETGKLQLMPKITKPIELIDYAIKATRVLAEKFGCHIEVEYPEKISKLFVDSEKIAWVLTNLLSNAIHYSKENSRVIIGARQDGDIVEMYVQDFGKGIDPRYHQSIFDRYFRVPGTKVQGSGLGLSISKDFIEAQNGTISVESEVGKGSKFIIRFNVK
ncbi:ATP-binding protein [uncultured Bacteroides sp.]|uniref:ATP-binding protein n=1 Tax=uncultured Bacteroides sp. TaxID=162156 RepID=UPI002AAAA00D|nr:ATP-binding protein [uncultured Bacteroides sp.]